jgi:hypothetical protein
VPINAKSVPTAGWEKSKEEFISILEKELYG